MLLYCNGKLQGTTADVFIFFLARKVTDFLYIVFFFLKCKSRKT